MVKTLSPLLVLWPALVLAAPGDLLLTIPNPEGSNQIGAALFGASLASNGNLLFVGAPGDYLGINTGSVHLFNVATGEHLLTIRNPNPGPAGPARFGAAVGFHDRNLIVGAPAGGLGSSPGPTYLFDGLTGNILLTLPPTSRNFGSALASNDHDILVGAPDDFSGLGAVYVYDATTGFRQNVLRSLRPSANSSFGSALTSLDSTIVVGAPGGTGHVFVFRDSGCYNPYPSIPDPDPTQNRLFGASITSLNGNFVVGAPPPSYFAGGAAYLYDTTGRRLLTITDDDPGIGMAFGEDVTAVGSNFLVTAPGKLLGGGDAFLFDGKSGDLLLTLPNTLGFGGSVTGIGNNIAIATPTLTLGTLQTVRIYEGYHVPEPPTLVLLAIIVACASLWCLGRLIKR